MTHDTFFRYHEPSREHEMSLSYSQNTPIDKLAITLQENINFKIVPF